MLISIHKHLIYAGRRSIIGTIGTLALSFCLSTWADEVRPELKAEKTKKSEEIKGSLVIIGGALRIDNDAVWKRIVLLAGGHGAKIAVIPAASGKPANAGKLTADTLNRYGADAFVIPLSINYKDNSHQNIVKDQKWIAKLRQARDRKSVV